MTRNTEPLSVRQTFQQAHDAMVEAEEALRWLQLSTFISDGARIAAYHDANKLTRMIRDLAAHPEWLMPVAKEGVGN